MGNTQFRTGVISPIECFKEGFELIKPSFWLLLGITIVGSLIAGFSMYVLMGGMLCGIFHCYLKKIDGKPLVFDDLWKGFQWWLPGLVVAAFIVIPILIVYGVIYIPVFIAIGMGSKMSEDELITLLVVVGIVDFVFVLIMVCFHTLLMFSFPLIADRGLGGFEAMKTSMKAVWGNLSGVVGIIVCGMGLMIAGYLALCLGIYFAIPILVAGQMVAYRKVFPALPENNLSPSSPPNFYPGN